MTLANDMIRNMSTAEKFSAIDLIWSTIFPAEMDEVFAELDYRIAR